MTQEMRIPLTDLVLSLSDTIDLVSPKVANHNMEVAYAAREIAAECGLNGEQQGEIMAAGALHDIGALSLADKLANLEFELVNPHHHAELSYLLLRGFPPFARPAVMARFHHVPWDGGEGASFRGERVPDGSHILHLADRVSVLKNRQAHILNQSEDIRARIRARSGTMFMPDLVDAFMRVSEKQSFWLNLAAPRMELPLSEGPRAGSLRLGLDELLSLTKLFAHIIDFRSKYTATHSAGVGEVAGVLAGLAGLTGTECRMMQIAGYLHDLGKLAVPNEILEKPGPLEKEEYNVIFSHPFYTYRALQRIRGFSDITAWASFHHERLNGGGYPYHLPAARLPAGARIMAVADVFTAILEDRPYQKDKTVEYAMSAIQKLADNSALDPDFARLLKNNLNDVNSARAAAQAAAAEEYRVFYQGGLLAPAGTGDRLAGVH